MRRVGELFGVLKALAYIRPPGHSYDDWARFLEECREAGVAAILGDSSGKDDGVFRGFATPLGMALLRRWRWLRDCQHDGIAFRDAERVFTVLLERDRAAIDEAERQRIVAAERAAAERDRKTSDLFDHAKDLGL